jgi:hypothetical protein
MASGCLRCGEATPQPQLIAMMLLCQGCLPTDAEYRQSLTGRIPGRLEMKVVQADRSDLGPVGSPGAPREIAFDPHAGVTDLEVRPGETVSVRMPLAVTARVKGKSLEPGQSAQIEAALTMRVWRVDRQQYEDRLVYIDRVADYYIEIWCKTGTAEMTWVSAPQKLSDHHAGGPRPAGTEIPPSVILPLGSAITEQTETEFPDFPKRSDQ